MEINKLRRFVVASNPAGKSDFKTQLRGILCEHDFAKNIVTDLGGKQISCSFNDGQIRITSEQSLNSSSRITLGSELDKFENRRVVCDWRMSEIDVRTIRRAVLHFGMKFADSGLGRVHIEDWLLAENSSLDFPDNIEGQNHHMCTTRMGSTQLDGVVDSNQRVFGIDNLYIAGSSVFSTSGHANPTFTIVQMSLRLGDHITDIHSDF
ncbi:MAG: hypothetical protein GY916_14515 [Gammaproteobacteria bacterium]|nr:hypothetical protein [Gammaproteobacteria bacterium]